MTKPKGIEGMTARSGVKELLIEQVVNQKGSIGDEEQWHIAHPPLSDMGTEIKALTEDIATRTETTTPKIITTAKDPEIDIGTGTGIGTTTGEDPDPDPGQGQDLLTLEEGVPGQDLHHRRTEQEKTNHLNRKQL